MTDGAKPTQSDAIIMSIDLRPKGLNRETGQLPVSVYPRGI